MSSGEEMRFCLEHLGAPQKLQQRVAELREASFTGREAFCRQLSRWRIKSEQHRTRVCEAALCGTLLAARWYDDLGLVSDDTPQFKLGCFVQWAVLGACRPQGLATDSAYAEAQAGGRAGP